MNEEHIKVSAYFDDKEEHKTALSLLSRVRREYDGLVVGYMPISSLAKARGSGLLIEVHSDNDEDVPPSSEAISSVFDRRERADEEKTRKLRRLLTVAGTSQSAVPKHTESTPKRRHEVYQVRLSEPICEGIRQRLSALDVSIVGRVEGNTYRMLLRPEQIEPVRAIEYVVEMRPEGVESRVTETYASVLADTSNRPGGPGLMSDSANKPAPERVLFDVIVHRSEDMDRVLEVIENSSGATIVDSSARMMRFSAEPGAPVLLELTDMPEVRSLNPYKPVALFCDIARGTLGFISLRSSAGTQWDGQDQLVAIFDSGVDPDHPDLKDRVRKHTAVPNAKAVDSVGHGTHVAGIIAGTGAASGGVVRGIAPGAELVCIGIVGSGGTLELPVDLGQLLKLAVDEGAKIINLSWGTPIDGDYDHGSLAVDQFVWDHPDVLVVVAAGNSGKAPEGYNMLQTVGTPASSKNVLTVGACGNTREEFQDHTWKKFCAERFPKPPIADLPVAGSPEQPVALSSSGPTDYDSIKPDLLAPGSYILAARASGAAKSFYWAECEKFDGRYAFLGGTSMAAPMVAGAAAVLRQYIVTKHGIANPSAALLKATLIASTRRLPPRTLPEEAAAQIGYPDFDQGFGRLDMAQILPSDTAPPNRKVLLVDVPNSSLGALASRMPPGSERKGFRTYRLLLPAGTGVFRVVLSWTDVPGKGMQNNLQLEVLGPNGLIELGNKEHVYLRNSTLGRMLESSNADKRNTTEQVVIENPSAGAYRIRVRAYNTPYPPQGYALCVLAEGDVSLEEF